MTTDSSGWAAMYGMHRADLVDLLSRAVPSSAVHLGHRAVSVEQSPGRAVVTFENGATAEADVVIAADGIHSALQPFVTAQARPVFSGSVAYRGLIDSAQLPH